MKKDSATPARVPAFVEPMKAKLVDPQFGRLTLFDLLNNPVSLQRSQVRSRSQNCRLRLCS